MIKAVSPTGEELIFYNYKEPLKEVHSGYGYYGVILSNKEGTKIQCHICGNMYAELSAHARQAHDISVRDYKEKYQLAYKTALISEDEREKRKARTIQWLNGMLPSERREYIKNRNAKFKAFREEKRKQPKLTLETKNKRGTCPDQLLDKIKKVAEHIGRSPTKAEFIDYFNSQKYIHIIYKTFGSWDKAKEMAGLKKLTREDAGRPKVRSPYSKEELIEYLQIFYQENAKPPTETDCRRGLIPDSSIYRRVFGSLSKAREEAGIYDEVGRWSKREKVNH